MLQQPMQQPLHLAAMSARTLAEVIRVIDPCRIHSRHVMQYMLDHLAAAA
jgi:hypothetical protein